MSFTIGTRAKKPVKYLFLIMFGFITFFPVFWMFYTSLKSNQEVMMNTFSLPTRLHFENYIKAWKTAKIDVYFLNSVIVSVAAVILTTLVAAPAAFILSKFKFGMRGFIYSIFIVGMLIPMQTVLVPLFLQMKILGLLDKLLSMILSYTAFCLPMSIFILESFIRSLPDSIIEAAVLDGASMKRIFAQIVFPLSSPAIATVSILNFLTNWKEFSLALIFISKDSKKTLPLGLYNFIGAYSTDYSQLMAAMVIASLPLMIIYLILQDQIINGMTDGAVKS